MRELGNYIKREVHSRRYYKIENEIVSVIKE